MPRSPYVRFTAALFGGLAAAAALFGVLMVASADTTLDTPPTLGVAWLVPIVAGSLVGVLAWLLLAETQQPTSPEDSAESSNCSSCGSKVLDGWRLCPYCGRFIEVENESVAECTTSNA